MFNQMENEQSMIKTYELIFLKMTINEIVLYEVQFKGHINVNSDFRQFYVDQSKQPSVIEYNGWPQIKIINVV